MDIDEEKKETPFTRRDGGCQYFDQKQRFPSPVVHAFYSAGSRNVTIDDDNNNEYHDNYMYAIDPHSSTNDMNTTNNYYIHHNRYDAIICSEDCSNPLI
jgi:hypothetical protein